MVKCTVCGHINKKGNKYCTECDNKLFTDKCSNCGFIIKNDDKFCGKCGIKIGNKLDSKNVINNDHVKLFMTNLNKLVTYGNDGFVIFELKTFFDKTSEDAPFVQFARENDKIILDFPYESDCYQNKWGLDLCKMLEQLNIEYTKDDLSIKSTFMDVESASIITHKIFTEIFKSKPNYKVNIKLNG